MEEKEIVVTLVTPPPLAGESRVLRREAMKQAVKQARMNFDAFMQTVDRAPIHIQSVAEETIFPYLFISGPAEEIDRLRMMLADQRQLVEAIDDAFAFRLRDE